MYSKRLFYSVERFNKLILTHHVCLRYLHKYATCFSSISSSYLTINYNEQPPCHPNTCTNLHKKIIAPHLHSKHYGGIFDGMPKPFLNYQTSRSFSNLPDPIADAAKPQYGEFMKIFFDSPPILYVQESLISLHASTGLPWWADIMLVTCAARTLVTLPLALYQQYILAKLALVKFEMDEIVKELKSDANNAVRHLGWTEVHTRSAYNRQLKTEWKKLIIRDNCHPMKGFILILVQAPLWFFFSAGLRNLAFMLPHPTIMGLEVHRQLSIGGFGWITNLTVADPYYILPILFGVLNLFNIEMLSGLRPGGNETTRYQKISLNMFRIVTLIMVPIAGIVPSCMSLYWITSSAYSILQNLLIYSPKVRRFVRIPNTEYERDHPYQHLHSHFKNKLAQMKSYTNIS